jgi:hypothetical protein
VSADEDAELGWVQTPWPQEVRACAVPDVMPVFCLALGAVVAVLAIGMLAARKIGSVANVLYSSKRQQVIDDLPGF